MNAIKRTMPLWGGIIVLLTGFSLYVPTFLAADNMIDLAQQISVNAIIAFGMTLTILIGGIDLSVGAVLAFTGTTAVYILSSQSQNPHTNLVLCEAIAVSLFLAILFGILNGLFATRTRIPPFIITLATMMVARGCALRFNQGRPIPVPDSQSLFLKIGNGRLFGFFPVPVLIMLITFIITAILLHQTWAGRRMYAIGGNREAARLSGIWITPIETGVYALCAFFAGIAGLIQTSQLYSAEPASGQNFELNAIAAVVVGGTSFTGGVGTIPGTLLGAIIIGILDKGFNQASIHYSFQYIVKGLVILTAVFIDVRRTRKH